MSIEHDFNRLLDWLPPACLCVSCHGYLDPRDYDTNTSTDMHVGHGKYARTVRMIMCCKCSKITIGDLASAGIRVNLVPNEEEEDRVGQEILTFSLIFGGDAVEDR